MAIPEAASFEEREQRWQEFQHDLRNYLSVIVTYSELLSRGEFDEKTAGGLRAINESATLALELAARYGEAWRPAASAVRSFGATP